MNKKRNHWNEFNKIVENSFPSKKEKLNKGISSAKLIAFEKKFNIKLPEDFKEIYLLSNGEQENTRYIAGLSLLPLEKIEEELNRYRKRWETADDFNQKWNGKIIPENSIKKVYYNPNWIPVISDLTGNFIAIDLDPGIKGTNGQIINFGADEYDHFVISDNFNLFFERINKYILTNNINQENLEDWGHLTDLLRNEIMKN